MSKPMYIIGIDPGKNGGIVIFRYMSDTYKLFLLSKMPDTPADLLTFLSPYRDKGICYLEKVGGQFNNGGSRAFNFGKNYGYIEMALIAQNIPTHTVTPQKWLKEFQLGSKGTATTTQWKNKLKAKAQALYPNKKITLWGADALLIGHYAVTVNS